MEIRILGHMEEPTDNNADQADWSISADEAREWQTQQDENELEYVGKARDYEMDFPLTHADCAGAGLYVFTKRRGPG